MILLIKEIGAAKKDSKCKQSFINGTNYKSIRDEKGHDHFEI